MTTIWMKNCVNFTVAKDFEKVKTDRLTAQQLGFKVLIYPDDEGRFVGLDPADISSIFQKTV